jgi:hypothetical protein
VRSSEAMAAEVAPGAESRPPTDVENLQNLVTVAELKGATAHANRDAEFAWAWAKIARDARQLVRLYRKRGLATAPAAKPEPINFKPEPIVAVPGRVIELEDGRFAVEADLE